MFLSVQRTVVKVSGLGVAATVVVRHDALNASLFGPGISLGCVSQLPQISPPNTPNCHQRQHLIKPHDPPRYYYHDPPIRATLPLLFSRNTFPPLYTASHEYSLERNYSIVYLNRTIATSVLIRLLADHTPTKSKATPTR